MFKCFSHWCRKFSSKRATASKKCETMSNSQPHLAIDQWLQKLDLSQYAYLLKKYNGVEDLLWLSERDFKILGIRNGGHRARLMSSLTVLKAKFGKANRGHHENANWSTGNLMVDTPNSKSIGSCSPVHHLSLEASTSGVRSWPSSGQSSKVHTRHSSHRSSMEGDIGVEASADELKKALERELSLDSSDVRSYAWYHGTILRQRAEELVAKDGDFIVRDCISQPGDYVVTTRWNGLPVHFIINKVLLQPNTVYEKTQYCFENEKFDSISGFITYYVGSKCPLSSNSGGVLSKPINRVMPLSYYASRYGIQCQIQYAARALEKIPHSPKCDLNCPPKSSPQSPKVNSKLQEIPQVNIDLDSAVCKRSSINSVSSHNTKKSVAPLTSHRQPLSRVGSDPMLSPNVEKTWEVRPHSGTISTESAKIIASEIESDRPPPKPSRVPSKKCVHRPLVIKRDRKLSPVQTGSTMNDCVEKKFESAYPKETDSEVGGKAQIPQPKRRISGETRFSFLDRRTVSEDGTNLEADMPYTIPLLNQPSLFNPSEYQSKFLEVENKPLPGAVLNKIKTTIFNESSKNLAYHLTRVDLEVMKIFKEEDLGLGVTSGLEFVLLPQGHQLQKDLLERMNCMKLFVAITILACSSEEERVKIIDKWIQIAMDTKTGFGNFCGYTGIMMGLTIPQVSCLQSTWLSLRQTHTDTAFAFETKLRPILKAMQETSGFSAPNTCIPFLLSLLSILQQHLSILELNKKESLSEENVTENILKFGLPGDQSSSDCGLQLLEDILENGRIIMQQCAIFRKNAEITLQNTKQNKLLLDVFSTEFHLRLLWGSKGANVSSKERHEKFQQVLNILSERCLK